MKPGWVYLLRCGWHYKIGKSANVLQRVADLQTANPYKIDLVVAIWVDDMATIESILHQYFHKYRSNGEWFEFDGDVTESMLIDAFGLVATTQSEWATMRPDGSIVAWPPGNVLMDYHTYVWGAYSGEGYRFKGPRIAPNRLAESGAIIIGVVHVGSSVELKIGQRIRHVKFGEGIVIAVRRLPGRLGHELSIQFVDRERRLISAYSNLTPLSD